VTRGGPAAVTALRWLVVVALAAAPLASHPGPTQHLALGGEAPAVGLAARFPVLADASQRLLLGLGAERGALAPQRGVLMALAAAPERRAPAPVASATRPPALAELGRRQSDGG
jgi:hypothetical protein